MNALASRLDVEVDRNGATWAFSWVRLGLRRAGAERRSLPAAAAARAGRPRAFTGTRVTYWPDRQTFLKDAALSLAELEERARQTSFLVPGLASRSPTPAQEVSEQCFRHDGGISEFCEFLAAGEAITDVIRHGQDRFTETVPMLDADGHMELAKDVERDLDIDIAVRWGTGYESTTRSYVNIIAT